MKEIILKNDNFTWNNILRGIFEIDDYDEMEKIKSVTLFVDEDECDLEREKEEA